jgi:hypothetical protein
VSLAPSAAATLGNLRYEARLAEVTVSLAALPGVGSARMLLPPAVEVSASPGDRAVVELAGGEAGAGPDTVLTGTVRVLRRGLAATEVLVADAGAELAALRPASTYTGSSAAEVARALLGDAGVTAGRVSLDLGLGLYVATQTRTAAEHLGRLAALAGGIAVVGPDGSVDAVPLPDQASAALGYGRELLDYELRQLPAPAARLVAVGHGPAGAAGAPGALRPSSDPLPAGAPAPGAGAVWRPEPTLRTPGAATAASKALEAAGAAEASRMRATCWLLPTLRPGIVVEVQGLPDGVAGGPWLLTHVEHRLSPGAAGATLLRGRAAGAGASPGALLESALSLAGGLP